MQKSMFCLTYPPIEEVESADHDQICNWFTFLPVSSNNTENETIMFIMSRWKELGGYKDWKITESKNFKN
jgi:hypothetical protein